jgi:hypothetical protein
MARRSASWRRRAGGWLAIGLLAFVATSVIVVWRRARGTQEEGAIAELDRQRRELVARRVALEVELRTATSAGRIVPAAEGRLGLRAPSDSQLITLVRARGADADSR